MMIVRDPRARKLKVPLEFKLIFEEPKKDEFIFLVSPGEINKFIFFSSWGSIFYWMLKLGLLLDPWFRPFSLLALTTEWGDHDIYYYPDFFNQETFGFLTTEFEIRDPIAVKTILESKGIKEFSVYFYRWKKFKRLEEIDWQSLNEEDVCRVEVPFIPISQGLSVSEDVAGEVPVWKVFAIEKGFEEILNRNPSTFSCSALGEIFSKGSSKVKISSKDIASKETTFFSIKHKVQEILLDWIYKNSFNEKEWIFGGKYSSLVKPPGKKGYFSSDAPQHQSPTEEGFLGTLKEFKATEEDYYCVFAYLQPETSRLPTKEGKTVEIYYPGKEETAKEMAREVLSAEGDVSYLLRSGIVSFLHVPVFLFREMKVFLFSERPDLYYDLITFRVDPTAAHFLGPGTLFKFFGAGLWEKLRSGLIISWSYASFIYEENVLCDLELMGIFFE